MRFNVAQQLKEPIGSRRRYAVEETVDVVEGGNPSLVKGELTFLRIDRGILVSGTLDTSARYICGRCLNSFEQPLTLKIEEEYLPISNILTGLPNEISDEETFTIDENHEIDLEEALRQYVLLAMPMKPLCNVNCLGLCPSCGKNLNEGHCQCSPSTVYTRWTDLQRLLGR